jgi:osmoprotectant transport system permease protein
MTDFLNFLIERRNELAAMTVEHLLLVFISTGIAVLLGVPLGLVLTRRRSLARPVIGFASVMQTVPSLALFGFLIPIPFLGGIGNRTAIVALVLYALLPILRNTYTGVLSVDPAVVEAGRGLGMTEWQRLRFVEIPLALPMILAGVRIAAVVSVGLATIAAAIGAGGLGNFIFRGLAMVDHRLILAGAIPAALLAIVADALLGGLEKAIVRKR